MVSAAADSHWNPVLQPRASATRGLQDGAGAAGLPGRAPCPGSWTRLSDPHGLDSCSRLFSLLTPGPWLLFFLKASVPAVPWLLGAPGDKSMNEQAANQYEGETANSQSQLGSYFFLFEDMCVCGCDIILHTLIQSYFLLVKLLLAHIMGLSISVFHGVPQKSPIISRCSATWKFENHWSIIKGKIIEHISKQDVWKKPFVTNPAAFWEVETVSEYMQTDKCKVFKFSKVFD